MNLENMILEFLKDIKGNVSVVVKNLTTNETININEKKVFPSASTIKLVIMSELLNQVKEDKLSLDETIILTNEMKAGGDGILKELACGHRFALSEIMTLMIIISDNTATNILIDLLGMENINKIGKQLGLNQTILQRRMMDLEAAMAGRDNYTSAKDMYRILELMYNGKNIDKEYSHIMIETLKKQQFNDCLNLYLPDNVLIAHKTGNLDKLEHDVGIVYLHNCEYIICVLTNKMKSNKYGREIIGQISKLVYEHYLTC